MNKVFAVADNIISSLGFTSKENFNAVINHVSGIRLVNNPDLSPTPFYASDINENILNEKWNARSGIFSKFEKLLILSVSDALKNIDIKIAASDKTIFILSTTKGNIDLLSDADNKRLNNQLLLQSSASMVANHFQNPNTTVVVSNACISGLAAIIIGKRLIHGGRCIVIICYFGFSVAVCHER
jgi:3-oxoacyl-[acyl-carrier-protein] synthase I